MAGIKGPKAIRWYGVEAEGGTSGSVVELGAWIGVDRAARRGVDAKVGVGETGADLVAPARRGDPRGSGTGQMWSRGRGEKDRIDRDAREVINNRKQRIFTEDEKEQMRSLGGSCSRCRGDHGRRRSSTVHILRVLTSAVTRLALVTTS